MRLALVTPRFWPLADDGATRLHRLAEQFRGGGHAVTIVTATWHSSWPREVQVREIPVVRLKGAPRGGWSTLRYMFGLARWLKQHRDRLDAVAQKLLEVETLTRDEFEAIFPPPTPKKSGTPQVIGMGA